MAASLEQILLCRVRVIDRPVVTVRGAERLEEDWGGRESGREEQDWYSPSELAHFSCFTVSA